MKEPKIPDAETLEDAIQAIVANNVVHGYNPKRFMRIMAGRSGNCGNDVNRPSSSIGF